MKKENNEKTKDMEVKRVPTDDKIATNDKATATDDMKTGNTTTTDTKTPTDDVISTNNKATATNNNKTGKTTTSQKGNKTKEKNT